MSQPFHNPFEQSQPNYGQPNYGQPQQPFGQPNYGQPQQHYAQAQQYGQTPPPPPPTSDLASFFGQRSAGNPAISFKDQPVGTSYVGVVARAIMDSDTDVQLDPSSKAPQYYADGSPKLVLKVPLRVRESERYPSGDATWYVNARARDELIRAMVEAGVPMDVVARGPEQGAAVRITLVERRRNSFGSPTNIIKVEYKSPKDHSVKPEIVAPEPVTAQPAPAAPVQQPAEAAADSSLSPEMQALLNELTSGKQ